MNLSPIYNTNIPQVTGKAKVEYFFDPTLVLPPDGDSFDTPAKNVTPARSAIKKRNGSSNGDADEIGEMHDVDRLAGDPQNESIGHW